MSAAGKTKLFIGEKLKPWIQGEGLDIGCGNDPILPTVQPFDLPHGDANHITQYVKKSFDFVFSSHCLEHMHDPMAAVEGWYQLVKPGGYLVIIVPDEDLYEQGRFPSLFNGDHKWTFTISKTKSWSPKSLNIVDVVDRLEDAKLVALELQDYGYDRSIQRHGGGRWSRRLFKIWRKWDERLKFLGAENRIAKFFHSLGAVIDQTALSDLRLAQIMFVVQKQAPSKMDH